MEHIDLDAPAFGNQQVLDLVPDLKAKALKNWNERGIFHDPQEKPGRGRKWRYTPAGVIALAAMNEIVRLGVPPTDAVGIGETIAGRAYDLQRDHPCTLRNGAPHYSIEAAEIGSYRRGFIYRLDGELVISIAETHRTLLPLFCIAVEVDQFILAMFNRIYAYTHGVPLPEAEVFAPDDESRAKAEELLGLMRRVGPI